MLLFVEIFQPYLPIIKVIDVIFLIFALIIFIPIISWRYIRQDYILPGIPIKIGFSFKKWEKIFIFIYIIESIISFMIHFL